MSGTCSSDIRRGVTDMPGGVDSATVGSVSYCEDCGSRVSGT